MSTHRPGDDVDFDFDFPIDRDALIAAVDLVGRSGATGFEVGFLHDDVPTDQAAWWAKAQYRGVRLSVENQPGPAEAAEALARRVLTGGKCAHCGGLVALSDDGAIAYSGGRTLDGKPWGVEEASAARQCRWKRVGDRWDRTCEEHRTPKTRSKFPRQQPRRRSRRHRR